jgi:hypothetical protein
MFDRTIALKAISVRVVRLARAMPASAEGHALRAELERLGLSLSKNYIKFIRARREQDHPGSIAHAGKCLTDLTEVSSWLEVIAQANLGWGTRIAPIQTRCQRLIDSFTAIRTEPRNP